MYNEFFELTPSHENCKSYYRKAYVHKLYDNDKCIEILKSYDTNVLAVVYSDYDEPQIHRLWDGYSATTMRHINEYLTQNGFTEGGKKWWCSLPISDNADDIELSELCLMP